MDSRIKINGYLPEVLARLVVSILVLMDSRIKIVDRNRGKEGH